MNKSIETDVVIVGGGPVGLSAALLLANQGVRSVVLERNTTTTSHPKASAFNTRTMEILRQLSIANDIYASTGPVGGVSFYTSLTGHRLGEVSMTETPDFIDSIKQATPSPLTISSQIVLEEALKRHADANKLVDVRFGHEKLSVTQGSDGVTTQVLKLDSGETLVLHSSYLIACDGAGSPTRKELGRELIGPPAFGHQINVYIEADIESLVNEKGHQALYWIATPKASGVFIGLGGDWKKWCFNFSYSPKNGETPDMFTPEICLEKVYQALGTRDLPVKILSIGPWMLCGQVIDHYREQRIFFGGDAAHLNIPTGGFGFNTGMQEIHNLSWKIAYVLRGIAPDSLLDTYHEERRDIAVFNVETSRQNAMNIRETGAALGGNTDNVDEIDLETEKGASQRKACAEAIVLQRHHFMFLGQEIGFGYWNSSIVTSDDSQHYVDEHDVKDPIYTYIPNAKPGARAPHCWVARRDAPETILSLLDLFGQDYVVIHSLADELNPSMIPEDIPFKFFSIGQPDSDLIDLQETWRRFYGIENEGCVLIRPDGHVAWRSDGEFTSDQLNNALLTAVGRLNKQA